MKNLPPGVHSHVAQTSSPAHDQRRAPLPKVSVIVPLYNEQESVRAFYGSIVRSLGQLGCACGAMPASSGDRTMDCRARTRSCSTCWWSRRLRHSLVQLAGDAACGSRRRSPGPLALGLGDEPGTVAASGRRCRHHPVVFGVHALLQRRRGRARQVNRSNSPDRFVCHPRTSLSAFGRSTFALMRAARACRWSVLH